MKEEISAELYVRYKCSSCMEPERWPECKNCADICRKYREVSPAELAGILKGKAWVLEALRSWAKRTLAEYSSGATIHEEITRLESIAPVSEFAKQAEEDRRKAEAWDKEQSVLERDCELESWKKGAAMDKITAREYVDGFLRLRKDLLAQSKIPPKAEEEKSDD